MTTTPKTWAQRLAEVQEAIRCIEAGSQSWRLNGQQYTRADLGALYKSETRYAKLAANEQAAARGRGRNRLGYIRF